MADHDNPGPRGQEHQSIPLASLDQFAALIIRWHSDRLKVLNHMLEIPEGSETEMEVADGVTTGVKLEGEVMLAFKLGIQTAIIEFTKLPFSIQAPEASNDAEPT